MISAICITLTPEQLKAPNPKGASVPRVVDPRTHEAYILVPENEYAAMRQLLEDERRETTIQAAVLSNAAARLDEAP